MSFKTEVPALPAPANAPPEMRGIVSKTFPEVSLNPYYEIPGSSLVLNRNRMVQDFTITTDSYVLLSSHLYEALCVENIKFAERVSESAFQYYAVMLLWKRLSQFLSPRSRRSSPFLDKLSSLEPHMTGIPKPLEIYLRGIGNFQHPSFGEMRFRLPDVFLSKSFNWTTGTFGKVTGDTHYLYEAFPAPGIAALRILNDLIKKDNDNGVWDLPEDLRPDFKDISTAEPKPTRNLLGWDIAESPTSEQLQLFQDSNISSENSMDDLTAFFDDSRKLLATISTYFDDTTTQKSSATNFVAVNPAVIGTSTSTLPANNPPSTPTVAKPNFPSQFGEHTTSIETFSQCNTSFGSVTNSPNIFGAPSTGFPAFGKSSPSVSCATPPTFGFGKSNPSVPSATTPVFSGSTGNTTNSSLKTETGLDVHNSDGSQLPLNSANLDSSKCVNGSKTVKLLPFEGSTIQALVVKRAVEPSEFDRRKMYCDGRVSVHSSWESTNVSTTGAVVAGYRMPKEQINDRHSWSCYDFNNYELVPESWVSTRNAIYMFDGIEGINIPMWSTPTTERKLTQYTFLKKHLMASGKTWNTYM